MKKILLLAMVLVFTASIASAGVVGSGHDLTQIFSGTDDTSQVCVYCHTPHQAAVAGSQQPLWNHSMSSTATYGTYTSPTLNATITELGGATAGNQSVSLLCMGCHDNTVALNTLIKTPTDQGAAPTGPTLLNAVNPSANLGASLVDDHPVNFSYTAALVAADGGLYSPSAGVIGGLPLFGAAQDSVQCATCHNVHNPSNTPFLRVSNTNSALCLICHNK
jgi:predicted CXXCH cytochrome family protein